MFTSKHISVYAVLQFSSMQALDDGARGLFDYLKEHGYDGTHHVLIERFNAENDVATSNAMAPSSDTGSERVGITVATKRRRKRKITSTTSAMVPSIVKVTSCSESRTEIERSLTNVKVTDCGNCA